MFVKNSLLLAAVCTLCFECWGFSLSRKTSLDGSIELSNLVDEELTPVSAGYLKDGSWFSLEAPDGFNSNAVAISYDGMAIAGLVGREDTSGLSEIYAIRWDYDSAAEDYVMELLGPGTGYEKSRMFNMSDNGEYVVGCFTKEHGSAQWAASYWDRDGDVHLLGSVGSSYYGAAAYDVSDNGIIVGMEVGYGEFGQFATIWDEAHGMRDLKNVLINEYGYDFAGWRLSDARYISADGTYMFGSGYDPAGRNVEWEAVIPEPGSLVLLGIGALLLRRGIR
jgi:uncharacterized membrane protein